MRYFIAIAIAALLTGCTPKVLTATPRTVMVGNVGEINAVEALQLAEQECLKHNRHAVHVPDNVRDGQASYSCVK